MIQSRKHSTSDELESSPLSQQAGPKLDFFRSASLLGILAGIYLRWNWASQDRSLWLDPAMLVWNVIQRGYGALFLPLDENQAAPYGFLCLLKAAGSLGDYSEASLVLVPFLAAVAALLLFARLAEVLLGRGNAPFAIWPLALSSTAVYYAGEVKQYSFDLLATTLLLWLALRCTRSELDHRSLRLFAGGSILAAWFSHASLCITVAALGALLLETWRLRNPAAARRLFWWGALVLAHHGLLYFLQMKPAAGVDLFSYNAAAFPPGLPWQDPAWYRDTFAGYFEFPLGYGGAVLLPCLGVVLGLFSLRHRRFEGALLLLPWLLLFAAATLHLYPLPTGTHDINSRLLLFTLPCTCLLIGRGFAGIVPQGRPALALLLLAFLAYPAATRSFGDPGYLQEEIRPLVESLRPQLAPGDQIYVFYTAVPAFRFYSRKEPLAYIAGRPMAEIERDLRLDAEQLHAGRVWSVFTHYYSGEKDIWRAILEERGTRIARQGHPGAVLELYELREPE